MTPNELCDFIQNDKRILTPDLLKGKWRKINEESGIRTTGHCYAAAEALFYLLGGKESSPYRPKMVKIDEGTHWFLEQPETGKRLDPTSTQFPNGVDYSSAIGKGFMQQSDRSKIIIERVKSILDLNSISI